MNFTKIDLSKPETLPPEGKVVNFIRDWPLRDRLGFMVINPRGKPIFYLEEESGDATRTVRPKGWTYIDEENE